MARRGQCLGGCHRWGISGRNAGVLVPFPIIPVLVSPEEPGPWRFSSAKARAQPRQLLAFQGMGTSAPGSRRNQKHSPLPPSSLCLTKHPRFFPSWPIGQVPQAPLALPPSWTILPGKRDLEREPFPRDARGSAPLPQGTRGPGSVPAAGSAPFQPRTRIQTAQPLSALFIPFRWVLALVIDCVEKPTYKTIFSSAALSLEPVCSLFAGMHCYFM